MAVYFTNLLDKIKGGMGDIELLYHSLIDPDPKMLKRMQEMPLVETPLHKAASSARTLGLEYVIEVATLMPTLMKKMDLKGQTPLHLALLKGNWDTARALIGIDSSLIRVKGKGGKTPLHVAVEKGQAKLLAEFLLACPSSIEDLTSRMETALHLAANKGDLSTFQVLERWLRTVRKDAKSILNSKNIEGNTALHLAVCSNKAEMVSELVKHIDLDAQNSNAKTALEICQDDQIYIKSIIQAAKEAKKWTYWIRKLIKSLWKLLQHDIFSEHSIGAVLFHWGRGLDEKSRDITLLVAVLIATAAYQGILSPPGGSWQDSDATKPSHVAGHMILSGATRTCYLLFNSISFVMSIAVIIACMPGHVASAILIFSVTFLLMTYFTAFINASPWKSSTGKFQALNIVVLLMIFYVLLLGWQFVLSELNRVKKCEKFQKRMMHLNDQQYGESSEVRRSDHSAADPQTHMMPVIANLTSESEPLNIC